MTDTVLYPCYIIMTEFSLFFGSILFPKNVANFTTHCILEWKKKRFCATKETRVQCNCIHITYLYFVEAHMFFWRIYIFMLVAGYSDSNRGGWFYINLFHPATFCACSNPCSSMSRFDLHNTWTFFVNTESFVSWGILQQMLRLTTNYYNGITL